MGLLSMFAAETDRVHLLRRHWKLLSTLTLAALLVHAVVLSRVVLPGSDREPVPVAQAMQVRTVALPQARVEEVASPVIAEAVVRVAPRAQEHKPLVSKARSALAAAPQSVVPAEPANEASTSASRPPVIAAPRYRTSVPPTMTLHYALRRGAARGSAELRWRASELGYELSFESHLNGAVVLRQTSEGRFDDAGLAPLRFTNQRARRELRATNFQREAGKISFSDATVEFALIDGAQDRLSWMVQLAAVVAAEPQRRANGEQVTIYVAGLRGDLKPWVFESTGDESVDTSFGPIATTKFVRLARETYDTNVEVWLDPAHHHMPIRTLFRVGPSEVGLELLLEAVTQ